MKRKILIGIFAVWIILWIGFIARELFRKRYFYDYKILLSRSLEGKHSYVTGDAFYEFLTFCNDKLPKGTKYDLAGILGGKDIIDGSIDKRRAVYYLYPNMPDKKAHFILIYDKLGVRKTGYSIFAELDDKRYILKKAR